MARTVKDATLESRKGRDRLAVGRRHWRNIRKGLAVGYYKVKDGAGGTWLVRWLMPDGRYTIQSLGVADDHQDATGTDVLDFGQACDRCYQFAARAVEPTRDAPRTVADAIAAYLAWYRVHRKAVRDTELTCEALILPALGSLKLTDLTAGMIRAWHEQLAATPARVRRKAGAALAHRESDPRARKATANRVLTALKAALNRAFQEGWVEDDAAWRRVKPFPGVNAPRVRHLSRDEATRLLNACDPDMRLLVTGALQTGCRYAELGRLTASDVDTDHGTVHVRLSKSGKPRDVPLTDEGRAFFARLKIGKAGSDLLFLNKGHPWGESQQRRPLELAAQRAGLTGVSFHVTRHTYGSLLAAAGTNLQVIAAALGHSDTRITERHYAHLLPSHVRDAVRAALPCFGVAPTDNVAVFSR
ncbi:MAG TPA: site-specific integrase [Candidatus Competibacter sp.]|jgi:integrase|nr:site-specific integrase [Candidatus Competibacter sp.]